MEPIGQTQGGRSGSEEAPPDLLALVDHREQVQVEESVEGVHEKLRGHDHEFAAVVEGTRFLGLVSRGQLGLLLGTRYGFILHSCHRIQEHMLPQALVVRPGQTLLSVLELALNRRGETFYHDLALVSEDGDYLGIIPVPTLVRLQTRLMAEQVRLAERQGVELERRNQDLFRSLHQLRQSRGRYETLFQNSPLGIALLDPNGRIETMNFRLEGWLEPAEGGAPAANLGDLLPAAERPGFLELLSLHEAGAELLPAKGREFKLNLPLHGPRLFQVHTSWVRETGQVCAVLKDVTELREMEREVRLQEKRALLETLVGGIAHELNNKMAPVLGFADLLAMKLGRLGGFEELIRHCEMIANSATESGKIIQQLRQLSRPIAGERVHVDIREMVEEACSLMRFRIQSSGTAIRTVLPEPSPKVWADPSQLKQVLINLMLNGIDAMEGSEPKLMSIFIEQNSHSVTLRIQDTGKGIPADQLGRIFDPFFTTKGPDKGTGLGLSVCMGILKQHGGEIRVESALGLGSEFHVILPLLDPEEARRGAVGAGRIAAGGERPTLEVPERRLDVMVVDDEEYITGLIHESLHTQMGWRVARVHSGDEAISRLRQEEVDLLITDLRMSGTDGFGVLAWLRESRPDLYRRTLVITGDAGSGKLNQELADLGIAVLPKPFSMKDLIRICRRLVAA